MTETPMARHVMPPTYSTGWIYVLENEHMPAIFKVGFTRKTVEGRIGELSDHTGVPSRFACVYYCQVTSPDEMEQAIHLALKQHRVSKSREFFRADIDSIIAAINKVAVEKRVTITEEWRHQKYMKTKILPDKKAQNTLPRATVDQRTLQVVQNGKASVSLVWVPLKGHIHQR
jgi:hypothetical protein